MKSWPRYIYFLADPRDGEIKYVGSSYNPYQRFFVHLSAKHDANPNKKDWILALKAAGLRPIIGILATVTKDYQTAERQWIARCLSWGYDLVNAKLRPSMCA